ncbi:MAG: phasin family protein [Fimbriimonadaceae bacterium]|nr:phasin family protein [Alphaproteobacteria bacterium]
MQNEFENIQKMGQQNTDAALKSIDVFTKGFQSIATEIADYSKKSFDESKAAAEKFAACKSFDKAVEVQTNFVRSAYEGYVSEMTKLGDMYVGVAKEVYKPIETAFQKTAK